MGYNNMAYRKWVRLFAGMFVASLLLMAFLAVYVDPFFHYHKPVSWLYYSLHRQRYQNDGIMRHFVYDAVITGTSMTENFRTTEFDSLFGVRSVKVPFSGGSFKEINDNLKVAYRTGHRVKYIVRALDAYKFFDDKDAMHSDLGVYPVYLYNDNLLDDTKYIFSKEVLDVCRHMITDQLRRKRSGITSFDEYSNWNKNYKFGREHVLQKKVKVKIPTAFTSAEAARVRDNIRQNVLSLAQVHPETEFYYFIPPYSCVYWSYYSEEQLTSYLAAERMTIEMLLSCDNIKLFSFDLNTELTNNLDNYKDTIHYGEWVNSLMLQWMRSGQGLIKKTEYEQYLRQKEELLRGYIRKKY